MSDCDEAEWFTLGIEEEYLLVDRILKFIVPDPSPAMFETCKQAPGPQVSHELMRSQIEVATTRHRTVGSARDDLANLRRTVAGIANSNGIAPIAAGPHPLAEWSEAIHTPRERYDRVVTDLQAVGRRAVTCGLQVHVGIPDDEIRSTS